jgi:hypothetical protein
MKPETWSYDGHGINGADEYRTRLVNFVKAPVSAGGGCVLEPEEQDRIGRLMAAAPELLAAARAARDYCDADQGAGARALRLALDAVIARATTGQ